MPANEHTSSCASIWQAATIYRENNVDYAVLARLVARSRAMREDHARHKRNANALPRMLVDTFICPSRQVFTDITKRFRHIARAITCHVKLRLRSEERR